MKINPITKINLALIPIQRAYPWVQCSLWIFRKNSCAAYYWRSDTPHYHGGSQTRLSRIVLLSRAYIKEI